MSKFTEADSAVMREMRASGVPVSQIAEKFGATNATVYARTEGTKKSTKAKATTTTPKVIRRPRMVTVPLTETSTTKVALLVGTPTDITKIVNDLWR